MTQGIRPASTAAAQIVEAAHSAYGTVDLHAFETLLGIKFLTGTASGPSSPHADDGVDAATVDVPTVGAGVELPSVHQEGDATTTDPQQPGSALEWASDEQIRQVQGQLIASHSLAGSRETVLTNDCVGDYLRSIARQPLLTAEEEVQLGMAIEAGLFATERLETMPADYELIWLARASREALETMILANLRLVVSIARRYIGHGMEFEDVIQEGNFGLIRAVQKFDYQKGFKFSTYATWWIKQSITRAIADKASLIRLPVHVTEDLSKIRRIIAKAEREDIQVTVAWLSRQTDLPLGKVEDLLNLPSAVSYDVKISDDDEDTLIEVLATEFSYEDELSVGERYWPDSLDNALLSLRDREELVLRLRYGLNDAGNPRTLDEIGKEVGLTRERIRQIEKRALEKLRAELRVMIEAMDPLEAMDWPAVVQDKGVQVFEELGVLPTEVGESGPRQRGVAKTSERSGAI